MNYGDFWNELSAPYGCRPTSAALSAAASPRSFRFGNAPAVFLTIGFVLSAGGEVSLSRRQARGIAVVELAYEKACRFAAGAGLPVLQSADGLQTDSAPNPRPA